MNLASAFKLASDAMEGAGYEFEGGFDFHNASATTLDRRYYLATSLVAANDESAGRLHKARQVEVWIAQRLLRGGDFPEQLQAAAVSIEAVENLIVTAALDERVSLKGSNTRQTNGDYLVTQILFLIEYESEL